ncbi:MAG: DsbA family protein [Candidatus Omnitrophota bacterium]
MKNQSLKYAVTAGIVFAGVILIIVLRVMQTPSVDMPAVSGRVRGLRNAPIQVSEYVDFRCGPCAHGTRYLKSMLAQHPEKIRLEVKFFPVHMAHGLLSFRYAECAKQQGMFWKMHDRLFATQGEWFRKKDPDTYFRGIAEEIGLDQQDLQQCVADIEIFDQIMAEKKAGEARGVRATPTYFINGEMVVGSHKVRDKLQELLHNLSDQE